MPTVKIPVKINYELGGGPGYNIFNARIADTDTDLENCLDAIEAFYVSLLGLYSTTTQIVIGEGMIADPYGSPTYLPDDVRTQTGASATASMATLLCITVGWRTTAATRSGRGRTFLGPLVVGTNEGNGTPSDAVITAVRAAAEDLVDASQAANGWAVGVYSHKDALLRDVVGSSVKDRFTFLSSRRD